jgi:hypothetical protein
MPSIVRDLLEALGPVVAAPRVDLDLIVGEVNLHPVAVKLLAQAEAVFIFGRSRR